MKSLLKKKFYETYFRECTDILLFYERNNITLVFIQKKKITFVLIFFPLFVSEHITYIPLYLN